MQTLQDSRTPVSLLGRLHTTPDDPVAWAEFVRHYGPKIYVWALRWKLQSADAEDVTQAVLLKLVVKLREFEYDPTKSFRSWLKTLTHHAWHDQAVRQVRLDRGSGDESILGVLSQVEARRSLAECLEEAFDQELFQEAIGRVQLRVEPRTWEAFRLMALENWSGAEVAIKLGMKVASVFVARSKVQRMLRDEIAKLE